MTQNNGWDMVIDRVAPGCYWVDASRDAYTQTIHWGDGSAAFVPNIVWSNCNDKQIYSCEIQFNPGKFCWTSVTRAL